MYVCIYVYVCSVCVFVLNMFIHKYMYICIYIRVYIYTYILLFLLSHQKLMSQPHIS